MIRAVDGLVAPGDVRLVAFEHVLADAGRWLEDWAPSSSPAAKTEDDTAPHARVAPSAAMRRLDSPEVAARELKRLAGRGALVCDVTTCDDGRDVAGLTRVAQLLRSTDVRVAYGASVPASVAARGADAVSRALDEELHVHGGAAFISLKLGRRSSSSEEARSETRDAAPEGEEQRLQDAALLEGARRASRGRVPVVATLPAASTAAALQQNATAVARALRGTETPLVIVRSGTRCVFASSSDDTYVQVLDGWMRPWEPALALRPDDVDEDDRARVAALGARREPWPRFQLSVGVRYATQLWEHGGLGYDAVARLADRASFFFDALDLLRNPRVVAALAHASPQDAAPAPLPPVTFRCTLCDTAFEVVTPTTTTKQHTTQHYAKFDNLYCSRACLARHRALGFAG
eukprot:CAMPEP_0185710424 /NCGR_PEP_ID=MMETSP1164-20130828/30706_1 /TAXON_ID=1104430 /ORGANISM="Chrysoreinhardia sp, Strain CCMP2950" /LENGTH=404 /DNA_ID=CAMNT_0028377939 /DNA_START=144 /DNA_END=1355 /DNA_ORIENTATION=+